MEAELMTIKRVKSFLGDLSERHIWTLLRSKQFPEPVRLGRAVRWRRSELVAWLAAGCPAMGTPDTNQDANREEVTNG